MHPLAEITAMSLVLDVDDVADLVRTRCPADAEGARGARLDFDIRRDLGRQGTRTLDRTTGLVVHAVGRLPGVSTTPSADTLAGPETGIVLATTMGSIQTTMDFTRDTFVRERPYHVDPARFPNTVMNFAAGQCAIRYRIEGPNATVTTGHVGSFTALCYATRLLRSGRARRVVVGASEELTPARASMERAHGVDEQELAEGAAALVLSPAGSNGAVGEVLHVDSGFAPRPGASEEVLLRLLERAAWPGREHRFADGPAPAPLVLAPRDATEASPELRAVRRCFGDDAFSDVHVVDTVARCGDLGSASGLVQLQSALEELRGRALRPETDCALVTSTDREGAVHLVLLRLGRGGRDS